MVEYFVPKVPFASYLFARWGQITGTPENCRRLLAAEEAVLVFPEGARGISKGFSKRYQLAEFGKGFVRLALEMCAPIVPIAVIGAEEQAPAVNVKPLARLLGAPSFPVVPYPPFLPVVPLPVKYRLYFGEPMVMTGDPDDDDEVLDEKVRSVKHRIQSMIQVGLREREHVFW
jgi:1-acyl-sn-glycerol-3-phosphate acyltransferase